MFKLLTLYFALLFAPFQSESIRDIGIAMKAGSAKELVKFCNRTVEIKLDGKSSNYSKNQAEVILKDFFSRFPAKAFSYIHQGSSPEGLKYTIGKYTHEKGRHRVVMFIKKIGDNYLIDTINFSEE